MDPAVVYNVASSLLAAVAEGLTGADLPEPCRMGVYPGQIVDDSCCQDDGNPDVDDPPVEPCGGQLAATFTRVYPAHEAWPAGTGIPITADCPAPLLTADYTVRYSMCVAIATDDDETQPLPSIEALDASGSESGVAAFAMVCAALDWSTAWPERVLVRGVTLVGPQGGCLGLDLNVTVELSDVPEP